MGGGGLTCMYSLIKVQLASEVAFSVATSLSSLFNPVFLKTHGKHLKKHESSGISSKSSNPWSVIPMGGITSSCVGIHFYSEYDVKLLISKFTSLFRATECKFPAQGLEIQAYSSRYQAVMIQLQRQWYFTKLYCKQHCLSSSYFSETLKSMGQNLSHFLSSRFPVWGMEQIIRVYLPT